MATDKPNRYVVNVVTRDHVGILAAIAEALYGLGGNLEALSETVVWGWFTTIICGAFPDDVTAEAIRATVEEAGDFAVTVLPFGGHPPAEGVSGEPFIVTASGEDKPGIVRGLTRCFAELGINIEDVWNEVCDERFIVIFHVVVPGAVDPKQARMRLEDVGREVGVAVTMQHQDIFTATNSIDVRTRTAGGTR